MGNIGGGEVLVILLAALLILGPSKLPEVARQMGKAIGEFRKVTTGFQRELQDAMNASDEAEARRRGEAIAATRPVATTPLSESEAAAPRVGETHAAPEPPRDDTSTPGSEGGATTPNGAAPAVRPEIDDHH